MVNGASSDDEMEIGDDFSAASKESHICRWTKKSMRNVVVLIDALDDGRRVETVPCMAGFGIPKKGENERKGKIGDRECH